MKTSLRARIFLAVAIVVALAALGGAALESNGLIVSLAAAVAAQLILALILVGNASR